MMLSDVWRLSGVSLASVVYIGTKSRIERPRKTKIGTEVAHVTCDSDTTFKVKRSKVKVTRLLGCFTHRRVNTSVSCSGERGNVLAVGNYCYAAVCWAARGASAPTQGGEGRGISWRPPAYSLLRKYSASLAGAIIAVIRNNCNNRTLHCSFCHI